MYVLNSAAPTTAAGQSETSATQLHKLCPTMRAILARRNLSANATAISPAWLAMSSQFKSAAVLGHVLFNREMCCLAFGRCVIRRLSQEFML
jgi:hypothetical protein